jgi:hypothetical protein
MKLQTMTVKAILCLDTDMFISRFAYDREDFLTYILQGETVIIIIICANTILESDHSIY